MPYWVGLDMGHERTSLCIIDKTGVIVTEQDCVADGDAIIERLRAYRKPSIRQIGVEAGVGVHAVRRLRAAGYPVRVIDVGRASKFLQINRLKTDASDARGLAELARVGQSIGSEVHVKSLEAQNIRTMLTVRRQLIRQRIKIEQLIQSIVMLHGGGIKRGRSINAVARAVDGASSRIVAGGISIELDINPLLFITEGLRAHQAELDRRIGTMAGQHPVCQLLMSVPGVGPITALSFYSAIDDPKRFSRISDAGAYFGLVPVFYQSGNSTRKGRINKAGCKMTRSLLVTSATTLLTRVRAESPLRTWAWELRDRAGPGKARVALARKLAVLLLGLWKSGQPYDPKRAPPRTCPT